jgi:hypothetical protein
MRSLASYVRVFCGFEACLRQSSSCGRYRASVGRDEERIEQEIGGAERPPRPRNLSSTYLQEALDALHAIGNAPSLYRPWPPPEARVENEVQRGLMLLIARQTRRVWARKAVLFAALAGESYVNEFISALVPANSRQYETLDRLSTVNKYLRGTRDAYGETLFFRDREPMRLIVELFGLRDKLVHPKPGFGVASWLEADDDSEEDFSPTQVAEYMIAVGGAGGIMIRRAYGFDAIDPIASAIWFGRPAIRAYAQRHVTVPPVERPPEPPLLQQALEHVSKRPVLDDPQLSINRLRAARKARRHRPAS